MNEGPVDGHSDGETPGLIPNPKVKPVRVPHAYCVPRGHGKCGSLSPLMLLYIENVS